MIEQKEVDDYISSLDLAKDKIQQLEKENAELKKELDRVQCDECMNFEDENIKLKQQLSEIKPLNRQEVEGIFNSYCITNETIITAICNLAVKIDKDKLVEVFARYECFYLIDSKTRNKIADEIIKSMGVK